MKLLAFIPRSVHRSSATTPAIGRTFYLSNTGNDSNDGLSEATPWATISKINASTFDPGDKILFQCDNIWREQLIVPSSGTTGVPVTFGKYATGSKPRLLGSKKEIFWTNISGNIWQGSTTFTNPGADTSYPGTIYFETSGGTVWGHVQKADTASLSEEFDWCWVSNKIYVYATANPDTLYDSVEVTQLVEVILLNKKENLVIDGLEVQYAGNTGIQGAYYIGGINLRGLTIKNCHISYIGVKGGGAAYGVQANYSDMLVQNNVIHSTGRRGFSIGNANENDLTENVIFEDNIFYDGYHTTGLDIACSSNGVLIQNITIRNNYFYDAADKLTTGAENYYSNFIFISEQSGAPDTSPDSTAGTGVIKDIYINNNRFKYPSLSAIALDNVANVHIYNNTFMGTNPNSPSYTQPLGIGRTYGVVKIDEIYLKNNIFYNDQHRSLIFISDVALGGFISDYNILHTTQTDWIIGWSGVGNLSPDAGSLAAWTSDTGNEGHSLLSDPLLNSDLSLQSGSPALAAGVDVGLPFTGSAPNIGATLNS